MAAVGVVNGEGEGRAGGGLRRALPKSGAVNG